MPSLFVFGALAPLDPILGVVAGLPWIADGCEVASETFDREVTQVPREKVSGLAGLEPATEAILRKTRTCAVEFKLSDNGSQFHPVQPARGRAAKLAGQFRELAEDPRLLQAWIRDVNGNAPLKDVGVGAIVITKDPTICGVRISTTLTVVSFASIAEGALVVDADLVAAGFP